MAEPSVTVCSGQKYTSVLFRTGTGEWMDFSVPKTAKCLSQGLADIAKTADRRIRELESELKQRQRVSALAGAAAQLLQKTGQ